MPKLGEVLGTDVRANPQMATKDAPCRLNPVPLNEREVSDILDSECTVLIDVEVGIAIIEVVCDGLHNSIDNDLGDRRPGPKSDLVQLLLSPPFQGKIEVGDCPQGDLARVEARVEDNCEDFFHDVVTYTVGENEASEEGAGSGREINETLKEMIIVNRSPFDRVGHDFRFRV